MRLQSIQLRQFRSYTDLALSVDPGVNLFLGLNGAGKTNIVEAIAVLSTGVSPRGGDSESMVQWTKDGFLIQGLFNSDTTGTDPFTLEMKYRLGSSRVIRENGQNVVRLRDLMGRVPLVSFVPEDLAMVKGEPELRRSAMNMILMQVDPLYAEQLRKYQEILRSRNAALKQLAEGSLNEMALDPWDIALATTGVEICRKRKNFLVEFSERAASVHERVSGGKETIRLVYEPSYAGPWEKEDIPQWQNYLKQNRARDIAVGSTMSGPHRDNFSFELNARPARFFASEGQKRTCAVSFKLAEIPYVQEKRGQKPICILDDVLSELDVERAAHLLDELSKTGQCFVTLTGLESWPRDRDLPASIFHVKENAVVKEEKENPALSSMMVF